MPATVDTAAPDRRPADKPAESAPRSGAVKIDIRKVQITQAPPARRYWAGVMSGAPFDQVTKGGVTFMKFKGTVPVADNGDGLDLRKPNERGDIVELTDDQLALVVKRVGNAALRIVPERVLRKDEAGNNVFVTRKSIGARIALDSVIYDPVKDRSGQPSPPAPYSAQENDVPLGRFLYLIPVSEKMPVDWRRHDPEPMCDAESMIDATK